MLRSITAIFFFDNWFAFMTSFKHRKNRQPYYFTDNWLCMDDLKKIRINAMTLFAFFYVWCRVWSRMILYFRNENCRKVLKLHSKPNWTKFHRYCPMNNSMSAISLKRKARTVPTFLKKTYELLNVLIEWLRNKAIWVPYVGPMMALASLSPMNTCSLRSYCPSISSIANTPLSWDRY